MHFRCPYCHADLGAEPRPTCPSCGKALIVPDHLRKVRYRDRQRAKERVHRELTRGAARRTPIPSLRRTPTQFIVLMVVMALLGALLISRARNVPAPPPVPPVERARTNLNVLRAALEFFHRHCGRYPTTAEGLAALMSNPGAPGWDGPYITMLRPDPWVNAYAYTGTATNADVRSPGPDATPNTPDDVLPAGWEPLMDRYE